MSFRFVVVDDDISIRKIIYNIIEQAGLGRLVAECEDGLSAEQIILDAEPDIVLVDLLLPGQDGVALIKKLRDNTTASFIMISESDSQQMITQAYENGIEFFIHKPINVLELVSVLNKVQESRKLKQFVTLISQTTARYASGASGTAASPAVQSFEINKRPKIYKAFSDMGIIGEAGAKNIYQVAQLIDQIVHGSGKSYQLHEVYQQLSLQISTDVKTIEQRIRRSIIKAMQNLANLGVDDYHNEKFQLYSTGLFEFKEVRQEMNFILGKSQYHGKINVKKFIEGLLFLAGE
ncbi:DNA-binding domain-containing protein|uniref:Two-component system, response regulator YcbB n=1 Tax=Dendrosporobacter quercicolus TaxID=146817 RepID=A0A1G9TKE8_9FIRM|nr:response regulator [Dendrosporobacter quercicolus]NSL48929.1 DNA-binding domain-containing protein [Dendrosporobacter quercicolus DSM 1736]SDM48279.1 two-component system, response regulator YcbB [Dendrosporobacter quercicolus]